MESMESDALSLEYKRDYGVARGQVKLSDIVNYAPLASELGRLGLRFPEQSLNLVRCEIGFVSDDRPDSPLVAFDSV